MSVQFYALSIFYFLLSHLWVQKASQWCHKFGMITVSLWTIYSLSNGFLTDVILLMIMQHQLHIQQLQANAQTLVLSSLYFN